MVNDKLWFFIFGTKINLIDSDEMSKKTELWPPGVQVLFQRQVIEMESISDLSEAMNFRADPQTYLVELPYDRYIHKYTW